MRLVSWNVNGIRSVLGKGFLEYLTAKDPDVLCLQETRASAEQIAHAPWPSHYFQYWNAGEKKGYSGTAILTKSKPRAVTFGMGIGEHDREGRIINAEFDDFILVNVYTPNSQRALTRLAYRTEAWDAAFLAHLKRLEKRKPVIFCGDLNVAHQEIDLANPKTNRKNAGFTPQERATFSRLLDEGFLDSFRQFERGGGHYTWWSVQNAARARNIGWRIDYFCLSSALRPRLKAASIAPEVLGSDHCPVGISLE